MVKASMSNTKYLISGSFQAKGHIEKTDLIGAFFGQTEGLLGEELEFTQLQKNGKLGRIEISLKRTKTQTKGEFSIPTALTKIEVSLVGAALESIEKISHCSGTITITQIKDTREEKRKEILARAEEMFKTLKNSLPQTQEISEQLSLKVKKSLITSYNNGEFFGGPNIFHDKELILVEGRADVLKLLSCDITNVLGFNGSARNSFISQVCKGKEITLFLDNDKGGEYQAKELQKQIKVSYLCFAPQGKEVEDLTYKEIDKALKNKTQTTSKPSLLHKVKQVYSKEKEHSLPQEILPPKVNFSKKELELKHSKAQKNNKKNSKEEPYKSTTDNKENTSHHKSTSHSKNKSNKTLEKDYFSQKEYEKIIKTIQEVYDKKEVILLSKLMRKTQKTPLKELNKLKTGAGKIAIIDGICEGTIYKKAKELELELIISKGKTNSCQKEIPIITFSQFEEFK